MKMGFTCDHSKRKIRTLIRKVYAFCGCHHSKITYFGIHKLQKKQRKYKVTHVKSHDKLSKSFSNLNENYDGNVLENKKNSAGNDAEWFDFVDIDKSHSKDYHKSDEGGIIDQFRSLDSKNVDTDHYSEVHMNTNYRGSENSVNEDKSLTDLIHYYQQEDATICDYTCFYGDLPIVPPQDSFSPQKAVLNPDGEIGPYLGPQLPHVAGLKTLVLDLDETLIHSSFTPARFASFIVSVELNEETHHVYVSKRPGVDDFLVEMAKIYEVVIFTASLPKYANPLIDMLDPNHLCVARLFRQSCIVRDGNCIKDLSKLGRDLRRCVIVDNLSKSYQLQPYNGIPIKSWYDDVDDTELFDLMPILKSLSEVSDIPAILRKALCDEFIMSEVYLYQSSEDC